MAKFLVAVALLMAVALAAKSITVTTYSQSGCMGVANTTKYDLDTCFPISGSNANWTAWKFGYPRDIPVATIYPKASTNCTVLGAPAFVACGRCLPYSATTFYRFLCDAKRQAARVDFNCNSDKCDSCTVHQDIKAGQCATVANTTMNVQLSSIGKMSAIPEIMFDNPNRTCTFHTAINVYDMVCYKCLNNIVFNCTVTGSERKEAMEEFPAKPHVASQF
jgi:hypothetical protein